MLKSSCKFLLSLATSAFLFAGANTVAAQSMKLAHGATADQAIGKGMLKFSELLAAKSNGAMKVETHLGGSLYAERTALEAMVNGGVDFAGGSNANWAAFTNALIFMDLPYVFNDEASFRAVLNGPVGVQIRERFEKAGFKLLMMLDNGSFRDIVNNRREVKVPTDLKGLKFRTTASPVEIAMFRHWGAIATAIDWAEVYNALGSGVVDGEFVMAPWLATAKHYEVLKHSTENRGVIGIQTLAMMKAKFDALAPDKQQIILDAAKEAEAYSNKEDAAMVESAREHARKLGVKTYVPTDDEMKVWRETGRQIWSQFDSKIDKGLLQAVLDAQKK